jgi:hypothetical protein
MSFDRRLRAHTEPGPMLQDEVWQRLVDPGMRFLCFNCMSERARERLNRLLRLADLRPCAMNLFHRPDSWFDLFLEMEAAHDPANHLHEWHEQEALLRGGPPR